MARKKYKYFNGIKHELARWTDSCSGCYESGDYGGNSHNYPFDEKAGCRVGAGCKECGYTGKRRIEYWVPVYSKEIL